MSSTFGMDPVHVDVHHDGARSSTIVIVGGVLATLAAIVLLVFPTFTSYAVTAITGWCLLVGGALLAVASFAMRDRGGLWTGVVLGLVIAIAGVLLVSNLLEGTMTLTAIAIAWLLVDGIAGAWLSVRYRPDYWGTSLAVSVLGFVLGLLLWSDWPTSASWAIGVYAGIVLLGRGLALVGTGLALRTAGE